MMTIYFFSRHSASPLMVQHLAEKLQTEVVLEQFTGTISNIKKGTGNITFTESLEIENAEGKKSISSFSRSIPWDSTIVAVAPITLQVEWLNTGVVHLLIPQSTKIPLAGGGAEFVYTGLLHVQKIQIVTEQWVGQPKTLEEVMEGRKLVVTVE